ncbi:hypothetical protein F5Y19DRAFT_467524 [Xylariaceae sp. FL1651]|nr:hypothetical protein F5Y19DRAFT_467524 [Xylariaceae sp. FL1651]
MEPSVAAPTGGLDALPTRPPTPPRERQSDLDHKLTLTRHPLASRLTLQTPPNHSPDSVGSTNTGSRRTRKRVEFTVQAEYRDPPTQADKENALEHSTPVSAPSSTGVSRPLKSILKPTSSPNSLNPLDPSAGHGEAGSTTNLAAMLESITKQLAGTDRDSKVDAYTMLVRALKTSTNLPDRIALQDKMSLFMHFIQRDITAKGGNGAVDSSLINHALTLLSTFLHFPAIASAVTPDFGVFIIDHCIRSFEDHATPKDVVRHLMQVVVFQDFPPKVMSADRVGRLVAALHNIEKHIKGKSIIMSRILIYRRLIRQSATHMVTHSDWLLDLFTDMLSSMKELRAAAIALGLEASFTVAKEKQLPKKVMEILQMTADETRYVEYYGQRLTAMTKEKQDMAAVPQIWSVVILLLRCPIDRWEFFDQWLEIIQRCFNSGDYHTKVEANYAWNRLVYALHLHESSFSKTVGTLCQPFNQLRRRGKQLDELRKVVIGGLCNLYYYAFKPNSSYAHIDHYWDACVRTLIRTLAFPETEAKFAEKQQAPSSDNLTQAANILTGLFDSSNVRLWKEDRIAENTLAKPDDLPALDSKWIRRNVARVFSVVEPILRRSFLELADPGSSSSRLWRSLIGAVATAASKEVKVSTETAAFLGHALSLLMKIWSDGPEEATASANTQQIFLKATETYLTTMILSLGHLPFTEKLLSVNRDNTLVPVATPSNRSGKGYGPTRSPLHHLFSTLLVTPQGISDGEDLLSLVKAVFEPFMLTRSPRAKRDLLQELMQISSSDGPATYGLWVFIAECLSAPVDYSQSSHSSTDSTGQPPIGHEFREIVKHLEKGINCTPNLPWVQWSSLFRFVARQATELTGEAGCSLAVVEPLAKAILESPTAHANPIGLNLLKCTVQLISTARQPRDRQALDSARRRLWGTAAAGSRSASFDPFDAFYRLASHVLETSYANIDEIDEDVVVSLLVEISLFLSRSNQVIVFKSLAQLQQGLSFWIQDVEKRYSNTQRSNIAEAVKILWDRVCDLFADTTLNHFQLDVIEQLLCCAFSSSHRHIVNRVIVLWNRAFEHASEIQYPETLKGMLLSLRSHVNIVLPGLEVSCYDFRTMEPSLVDSQDDLGVIHPSAKNCQGSAPCLDQSPLPRSSVTPGSTKTTASTYHSSELTHSRSRAKLARRNRTPRLRHDDSQIQFAAIEQSSPSSRVMGSQVLTDRQREVRERQLENAVLFSSIRSSPDKEKIPIPVSRQASPQQSKRNVLHVDDRIATPKATRSYEYVSSTPTPRRGQASILDEDHEMTDDIPSSPPEPRRNLLPEMKSHARSTSMLEDMPISSSPVSGSPAAKMSLRAYGEELSSQAGSLSFVVESTSSQRTALGAHKAVAVAPQDLLATSDDELIHEESHDKLAVQRPVTPTNLAPPNAQETPKSETEVFVDALTSSTPQASRRRLDTALPVDRSFEMSDGEERSMARLVIELDSRKCDPLPSYDTSSPEKGHEDRNTMECITVNVGCEQTQMYSNEVQSSQLLPPISSSVAETDDSQSSEKRSQKRKRVGDKKQHSGSKKRKNHKDIDTDHVDTVVDRQVPLANDEELPSVLHTELVIASDGGAECEPRPHGEDSRAALQGSPDLAHDPCDQLPVEPFDLDEGNIMDADTAAVHLQLITEASQQTEAEHYGDAADDDASESLVHSDNEPIIRGGERMERAKVELKSSDPEESAAPPIKQSEMERIIASLKDGLEGLRAATLSREDVYKIEDMFMDIKKELYEAERRSRR